MRTAILTIILWLAAASAYAGMSPVFTIPECGPYHYELEIIANDGTPLQGPSGNFFCTASDFDDTDLSGNAVLEELARAIGPAKVKQIDVVSYYNASAAFAAWLCALPHADDLAVSVYSQNPGSGDPHITPEVIQAFASCGAPTHFMTVGCYVFQEDTPAEAADSPGCPRGAVNILHVKIARLVLDDGRVVVLTGSGNFNKSLFANIEDWQVLNEPVGSKLERQAYCMLRTIDQVAGVPDVSQGFASGLFSSCLSTWGAGGATEVGGLYMAPAGGEIYRKRLIEAAGEGSSIDLMAQLPEDPELIAAISKNVGAKVRIILDDDWYWAIKNNANFGVVAWDKAQPMAQLIGSGIVEVRYVETNGDAVGGRSNTLHTRLMIVGYPGASDTVYTGSAHFRRGSFRLNYESLWELRQPELADSYRGFFQQVWDRATPRPKMPRIYIPPKVD